MDVAGLDLAHGTVQQHGALMRHLRQVNACAAAPDAVSPGAQCHTDASHCCSIGVVAACLRMPGLHSLESQTWGHLICRAVGYMQQVTTSAPQAQTHTA